MKVKYEDRQKQKVIAITTDTLVVGVDIAKNYQWARFVDLILSISVDTFFTRISIPKLQHPEIHNISVV